ncbi:amino acid transporter heavy chain SLC3A1-like [Glandiceps talaboti]
MDNKGYDEERGGIELKNVHATVDEGENEKGNVGVTADDTETEKEREYVGLTREELLERSNSSTWKIARWTLFILLLLGWIAILGGAIYIMVSTPRCLPWWQTAVFYQLYPRSFKDTSGDGIGDLGGIEEKIDYLQDIGVNAIWMNSVYKSPQVDNGYDVSDYYDVDPLFGDVSQFQNLLSTLKDKGLRVILDFIPNHSSDHHAWFNESRMSKDNDYKSHYIWVDGAEGTPPNNWKSVWGGSAWTYVDEREQYYLHQFLKEQPDLNWRNDDVKKEFDAILEFWLRMGVDGFRINAVQYLLETDDYSKNEKKNEDNTGNMDDYDYWDHANTREYDGVHDIVRSWRTGQVDHYSTSGAYRFLTSDAEDDLKVVTSYYGITDFPQNLNFLEIADESGDIIGKKVQELVQDWMESMPDGSHPNFLLGNHDKRRIASRVGQNYIRACHMLLLTLPGSPTIYYGDEIGMEDINIPTNNVLPDPLAKSKSRDVARSPMQWSAEDNAGFSNNSDTWLPINSNYGTVNVETQLEDEKSLLNLFKALTSLRAAEERVIPVGSISYVSQNDDVFAYIRESSLSGFNRYLVAINFGLGPRTDDDYATQESSLPAEGEVVVSTGMDRNGERVKLTKLSLKGGEGVVIKI